MTTKHVHLWNTKTHPWNFIVFCTVPKWIVLVAATQWHIDDPIIVLDLLDLHGFLYFLIHRHLSLHLHRNVHNLLHSPLLDSFL